MDGYLAFNNNFEYMNSANIFESYTNIDVPEITPADIYNDFYNALIRVRFNDIHVATMLVDDYEDFQRTTGITPEELLLKKLHMNYTLIKLKIYLKNIQMIHSRLQ